jgi:hypothetical protein
MDDGSKGIASRPDLKCPGCGQCYQWEDSAHWVPVHPVRAPLRIVRSAEHSHDVVDPGAASDASGHRQVRG